MVFALYPEYNDALLRDSDNENIKKIITACFIHSFEPIIASALNSKKELCRMTLKKLWKIIKKEYSNTPFDIKWNLFTELQSIKISNNYKNYSKIIKQFDEHKCCLLKAGFSINKLLSPFFLNIMPNTVKQFKISNQMSEDGKTIPNYYYIKQIFNCFINEEFSYDCQNKIENNHLNMMTNRQDDRPCLSTILSNWNNNSSNTELNLNNALNTSYNQCESLNHKGINYLHKDKICNYCKREKHL